MKKLLFCFSFLLLCSSQLSAQLELGVRGSVAFFLPTGDGTIAERVSLLPGGEAGLFAGMSLGRIASVRAELMYISKRWTQAESEPALVILPDGSSVNGLIERTFNTTNGYISIPIVMEIVPINGLGINFGPNFGFLARSIASGDITSISDSLGTVGSSEFNHDYLNDPAGAGAYEDLSEKLGNLYRSLDVGWNLGLAFRLNNRITLDIRSTLGLMDIVDASYRQDFGSLLERNLTFTTGLRFYLAGKGLRKDK